MRRNNPKAIASAYLSEPKLLLKRLQTYTRYFARLLSSVSRYQSFVGSARCNAKEHMTRSKISGDSGSPSAISSKDRERQSRPVRDLYAGPVYGSDAIMVNSGFGVEVRGDDRVTGRSEEV